MTATPPGGQPPHHRVPISRYPPRSQALLDPDFQPEARAVSAPLAPLLAPHASQSAGKGMLGAALARHLLDAARGWPSLPAPEALAVGLAGVPPGPGAALPGAHVPGSAHGCGRRARRAHHRDERRGARGSPYPHPHRRTSGLALLERSGMAPARQGGVRGAHAGAHAPRGQRGHLHGHRRTATAYLTWRQSAGTVTPERVLTEFSPAGHEFHTSPARLRLRARPCVRHPETPRLRRDLPGMNSQNLMVAGLALYEKACSLPDSRREAIIAMANNYLAWREQHDIVQRVFTPARPRWDEVSANPR